MNKDQRNLVDTHLNKQYVVIDDELINLIRSGKRIRQMDFRLIKSCFGNHENIYKRG